MFTRPRPLHLEGWTVIPHTFFALFIVLPLIIAVLLPLFLITKLIHVCLPPKRVVHSKALPLPNLQIDVTPPLAERPYDLVLVGATGFTGRLVALYLARHYGTRVKWALCGRRESGLREVRLTLAEVDPALADIPLLIADAFDGDSLAAVVRSTRVVLSTAGPYVLMGTTLVQLCAYTGTSYCDITGETDWVREMVDRYDDVARQTGARIVHHCGHDCAPWDLGALMLADAFKADGKELMSVEAFDEVHGEASGGTMATLFLSLSDRSKYRSQLGFDPLLKTLAGVRSSSRLDVHNQTMLGYNSTISRWVGPFVMAPVMANCVRRSHAVNAYSGDRTRYAERLVFPSMCAGVVYLIYMLVQGLAFSIPALGWAMKEFVLPKPGEGPSEAAMKAGFLNLSMIGRGSDGGKKTMDMYFDSDPGYADTARLLVESGMCFVLDGDAITSGGGVWTPATCLKGVLLKRIIDTGTRYRLIDNDDDDGDE